MSTFKIIGDLYEIGMIIPHLTTGIKSIETTVELVLIVEKDTVFQRLLTADLHKHIGKHCILVTVNTF